LTCQTLAKIRKYPLLCAEEDLARLHLPGRWLRVSGQKQLAKNQRIEFKIVNLKISLQIMLTISHTATIPEAHKKTRR
jgi:hypothetical protein